MPQPQWTPVDSCMRFTSCEPNRIVPDPQAGGKQPEKALSRETVLRICLALDDGALAWVYQALFVDRAPVMEEIVKAWASTQSDNLKIGAFDIPGNGNITPGHKVNGFVEMVDEAEKPAPLQNGQAALEPLTANGYQNGQSLALSLEGRTLTITKDEYVNGADDEAHIDYLHKSFDARDRKAYGCPPDNMIPRIQFWTEMSYCNEADNAEVAVLRVGDVSKRSAVLYATKDISAKAGKKYTACSGKLVFEIGERMKFIKIPTTSDEAWDATLEFEVLLKDDGVENAVLEAALSKCRIKIIDDDCFPTNKFQKQIVAGELHKVSTPLLLLEYFKMNVKQPVVRRGLIKTVLADQVNNIYWIMCLFLDLWMVDYVLCETCDTGTASASLQLILLLKLVPFGLIHWLQFKATGWKVSGTSRMTLQANLLRKYLNYDESSAALIDESRLIMAMTRDAFDLVGNAFCKIPRLLSALVRLCMLFIYQMVVPVALGESLGTPADLMIRFAPLFLFPVAMASFLYLRNPRTLAHLEKQKQLQNEMLFDIKRTIGSFDLIRDYRKRGTYVDLFEKKIKAFNSSFTQMSGIVVNNNKFASWCSILIIAAYIQVGGMRVVNGNPVGAFLNNLAIYGALGEMWGQVYDVLLDMQNVFDALTTMVEYMNLPTDSAHRKAHYDMNNKMVRQEFEAAVKSNKWPGIDPVDTTCIELRNMSFKYKSKGLITSELKSSSAKFVQGGLYALVGPPSQGKGTILQLLGEVLIPWYPGFQRNSAGGGGNLIIPTHLSTLHVSKEPSFVEGSLFYNLTFGCPNPGEYHMDRVIVICRKLGLADYIINTIKDQNMKDCDWGHIISSTEIALLHVARALITNPEVICIHKPALYLNTEMSDNMYKVLKEFVTNRGLEEDPAQFYHRRPRTCIVSARRVAGPAAECADAVYHVSAELGLQRVKNHIEEDWHLDAPG